MKSKLCYFVGMCFFAMLFAACKSDDPTPEPPVSGEGSRTVLVYIVGDNDISRFIEPDIAEMLEGMKSVNGSQYKLLVYLDSYDSAPTLFRFAKNKKGEVIKEVIKEYDEQNSTDTKVMTEVVNRAFKEYPSESYGLVYWSHAEGWLPDPLPSTRWVGDDNGSHMNLSDLKTVLSQTPHLDFILFDACFMVSVEVAYELRQHVDYIISSPTETPGTGAPYQVVVPAMFSAQDGVETKIAEAYMAPYVAGFDKTLQIGHRDPFDAKGAWVAGVAIGVLKTNALDKLASITKRILPDRPIDNWALRSSVFNYDKRGSGVGYFDMAGIIRNLVDDEAYREWEAAFLEARSFWNTTSKCYSGSGGVFSAAGTNGVTHFIPLANEARKTAYRSTAWYTAAGLSKLGW